MKNSLIAKNVTSGHFEASHIAEVKAERQAELEKEIAIGCM